VNDDPFMDAAEAFVAERRHGWGPPNPASANARLNALLAVEHDPVRRRERLLDLRLAAAVVLADRLEVCEALLAGVPVPASRLDPLCVAAMQLSGDIVLDEELALAVAARRPLDVA
jgi:hypothetical protein